MTLFRLFTLYGLTFGRLYVCKCSSILFKISNYDFWISLLSVLVSHFHLEFINYSLFFPFWLTCLRVAQYCLLTKEPIICFLDPFGFFFFTLFICFFFFINFCFDLDYFLWLLFVVGFYFSKVLKCNSKLFIWIRSDF